MVKNILCFGDSNTWGYSPVDKARHPIDVRWTGVLQASLGAGYRIIEEGLNGRTTFKNEEGEDAKPMRSGSQALPMILESQRPLDLVVLMLGTNDLKKRFQLSLDEIAEGVADLVKTIKAYDYGGAAPPKIMLVSPALIGENMSEEYMELWGETAPEKSRGFEERYCQVSRDLETTFVNAAATVTPAEGEGIHWDAENHQKFGEQMSMYIQFSGV